MTEDEARTVGLHTRVNYRGEQGMLTPQRHVFDSRGRDPFQATFTIEINGRRIHQVDYRQLELVERRPEVHPRLPRR